MKKFVLTALASAMLGVCHAQNNGYVIRGTVKDVQDGVVYLMNKLDTLGEAKIEDGKFVLKGKVDEPLQCTFVVEGVHAFPVAFFLENADITADLNIAARENVIKGGEEQAAFAEYEKLMRSFDQQRSERFAAISTARSKEEADSLQNLFNRVGVDRDKAERYFIRSHPDAACSASLIAAWRSARSLEFIREQYNMLSAKGKSTYYGRQLGEIIAMRERTDKGQTAADFVMTSPTGERFNMYDMKTKKYKLILFWLASDPVGYKENEAVLELYNKYHDQGLEVIGVCGDEDQEVWKKAIWDMKLPWIQGTVDAKEVSRLYGLNTFLNIFVLDENNVIVQKGIGGPKLKAWMDRQYKK